MTKALAGWTATPETFKSGFMGINPARLGVGMQVTMQVKTHRKKRINKKWRKKFGIVSWVIPSEIILEGKDAVSDHVHKLLGKLRKIPDRPTEISL